MIINKLKFPKFLDFFGPTGEEVMKDVNLAGKTCLITGGNSGIGLEITKCLMSKNCEMMMTVRNTYAAKRAISNFEGKANIYEVNLASLESVKRCVDKIVAEKPKIDIVILNAAVFAIPWMLTKDKLETIFQVNYLSQYYMLMGLEDVLAEDARVVIMSSESHRNIRWSLQNIMSPTEDLLSLPESKYTSIKAYNVSKLCGIHAMHYLSYRWSKTGKSIFCVHPGSFVKTKLPSNWWPYEALYTLMIPFSKSVAQAASTPLYCAVSPHLHSVSGFYFKDMKQADESELAKDTHLTFRIIQLSENMLMERVPKFTHSKIEVKEKVEKDKSPIDNSGEAPNLSYYA